jgi:hypothetical protein
MLMGSYYVMLICICEWESILFHTRTAPKSQMNDVLLKGIYYTCSLITQLVIFTHKVEWKLMLLFTWSVLPMAVIPSCYQQIELFNLLKTQSFPTDRKLFNERT